MLFSGLSRPQSECAPRLPKLSRRWLVLAPLLATMATGCASWCRRSTSDALVKSRQIAIQGMEAEQQGQYEQAEKIYASAVQACPHDERAQCRYAESLWRRGAHAQAIAHMEESVRLSQQSAERVTQLARMNHELGDSNRALEQATKALERDRDFAAAWILQGDIAKRENRPADALAHYQRATALPNCPPIVYLSIADIYAAQNRPQRALGALQSLSEQFPAGHIPPEIAYRQGLAYRAIGRNEEAITHFAAAANHPQAPPEVRLQLAEAQRQIGDVASAKLTVMTALERFPNHPASLQLARELSLQQERLSAALPRGQ